MSFILDALKKAESERTRNAGPVLMDVRIAQSRQRLPGWAWMLALVLLANMALLGWVLLRKPPAALQVEAVPAVVVPPAAPAALPPPQLPVTPSVAEPVLPTPSVITPEQAPVPALAAAPAAAPESVTTVATPSPRTAAVASTPRIDNLPTYQDLVAQGVPLPTLQMNLHVYDEAPANRYVLLNSRRLREGDEVADGVRVETIVPRGMVLSVQGRRFVLLAGN